MATGSTQPFTPAINLTISAGAASASAATGINPALSGPDTVLVYNASAPEADEAPERAAREERERIGRQMAHEEAGRKDAERRAYVCEPDWIPTEMQNAMARGSVQVGEYRYVVRKVAMGR